MNILVTAGNTQAPLDQVRCITNIFSGRTGAAIASRAFERGHSVTLLTSTPDVLHHLPTTRERAAPDWQVHPYRTFTDLASLMETELTGHHFDAVIHAAAVSDFLVAGVYTTARGTDQEQPEFIDVSAGKVKSHHHELWIRLTPAPKLVDRIREPWGFRGQLVKFKLEVGPTEPGLEKIAAASRIQSDADFIVANTLDGMHEWAIIGDSQGFQRITRIDLPDVLLKCLETSQRRRDG